MTSISLHIINLEVHYLFMKVEMMKVEMHRIENGVNTDVKLECKE